MYSYNKKIISLLEQSSLPQVLPSDTFETHRLQTGFAADNTPIEISFKIPSSIRPFQANPLREIVLEEVYKFGIHSGHFLADEKYKAATLSTLSESRFIDLSINALPDIHDVPKLKKMATWIFILFKFDDIFDNPNSVLQNQANTKRIHIASKLQAECYKMLSIGPASPKEMGYLRKEFESNAPEWDTIQKLFTALHSLHEMLIPADTEKGSRKPKLNEGMNFFLTSANKYFQSAVTELRTAAFTSESAYLEHRKNSGAVPTAFALSFSLYSLEIPEAIKNSEYYNLMFYHANMAICLVNDGVSNGKEWTSPEPNFFKLRYQAHCHDGKSPRNAFMAAKLDLEELHDLNLTEYSIQKDQLRTQLSDHQLHLNDTQFLHLDTSDEAFANTKLEASLLYQTYADTISKIEKAMDFWIQSNLHYSQYSARYKLPKPIPI